jgi:hypothetical protein
MLYCLPPVRIQSFGNADLRAVVLPLLLIDQSTHQTASTERSALQLNEWAIEAMA